MSFPEIKPFERRSVLVTSPNTNTYLYVNNMLYKNDLHLPIIHVLFCECATIATDNGNFYLDRTKFEKLL